MFAVPYFESSASIAAIFVCEMLSASINSAMRLSVAALMGRSLSIFIALSGGDRYRSSLRILYTQHQGHQHQDKSLQGHRRFRRAQPGRGPIRLCLARYAGRSVAALRAALIDNVEDPAI